MAKKLTLQAYLKENPLLQNIAPTIAQTCIRIVIPFMTNSLSILLPHYAKQADLKITTYALEKYREACDYAALNKVIKQVLRKNNIIDKKIRIQFDYFFGGRAKNAKTQSKNPQTMQISKPNTLHNLTNRPKDKDFYNFKGCKLYAARPHILKGNQAMR